MSEENENIIAEVEIVEKEEDDALTKLKLLNIQKLEKLLNELNKIERKRDPNIRICPQCFSLRVKTEDTLSAMGIYTSYPTCRCLDCGWRSQKWIYLDRTLTDDERNNFIQEIIKEKNKK